MHPLFARSMVKRGCIIYFKRFKRQNVPLIPDELFSLADDLHDKCNDP